MLNTHTHTHTHPHTYIYTTYILAKTMFSNYVIQMLLRLSSQVDMSSVLFHTTATLLVGSYATTDIVIGRLKR